MDAESKRDVSGTEMQRGEEQQKVIAFCTECGFVQGVRAPEEYEGTEHDPAFRHYQGTDHLVGSFVPVEGSELEEQWEIAYAGDWSELEDNDRLMELAQGVEA